MPSHDPRQTDPHYHLFAAAKRKMKQLDLPCWRCDVHYKDLVKQGAPATEKNPLGAYQLEAHHSDLEFSLLNGVDIAAWWDSSTRQDAGFIVESSASSTAGCTSTPSSSGNHPTRSSWRTWSQTGICCSSATFATDRKTKGSITSRRPTGEHAKCGAATSPTIFSDEP